MASLQPNFKFRCESTGHSQDVRCIQYAELDGKPSTISASRDCTARLWQEDTAVRWTSLCVSSRGHSVSAHLLNSTQCASGLRAVLVVGQANNEAAESSRGSATPSILSASADKSVILWVNGKPQRTFQGIFTVLLRFPSVRYNCLPFKKI